MAYESEASRQEFQTSLQNRSLIERAPAVLFVASAREMRVFFVSEFAETLFGSTRSLTRDPNFWRERIYEADRAAVVLEREHAIRNGDEYDIEYRMLADNGDVLWVRELGRVIVSNAEPLVVGVIVDLTKKRSTLRALGEGKRWLRWLIDGIPSQVWSSDPAGTVDFCNARWRDELGLSLDDVKNEGWQEMIHPEDLDRIRLAWRDSVEGGTPYEQLERHRLVTGDYRWFLCRGVPLRNEKGDIVRWIGLNTDVNEQKEAEDALRASEQRWRAVFDNAWVGVALMDPSLHFVEANAALQQMTGYSVAELRAMTCLDLTANEDREKYKEVVQGLISGKRDRLTIEKRYQRKDGTLIWVRIEATAILGGQHRMWVKIVEDVTERKRLDDALREERDRLRLLLDLNNKFVPKLEVRDVFDALSTVLHEVEGWEYSFVALPESEQDLKVRLVGPGMGELKVGALVPIEGTFAGNVYRSGRPEFFRVADLAPVAGYPELTKWRRFARADGLQAAWNMPLLSEGRVLGVLGFHTRRDVESARADLGFLQELANLVSVTLGNALRYGELSESREKLAYQKSYMEAEFLRERGFEHIIGQSSAMAQVLKQIRDVAPTDSTVLITGETGTGKELIARAIHDRSPRSDQGFIKIDCSAIPPTLMESELFGHERGAFTGAISQKIGRFEAADKGTILLDEIGEMPMDIQPTLLRVLQDRAFERVGGTRLHHLDLRILVATHRNLESMVEEGKFREDLFYRLKVFPIFIPPLRERPADIPPLIHYYVAKFASRMKKEITTVPHHAMNLFTQYEWPGNVRELQHFMERSVILTNGPVLQAPLGELERIMERMVTGATRPVVTRTLEEVERDAILNALRQSDWVVGGPRGAAIKLNLKRTTLASRMEKLGIHRPKG